MDRKQIARILDQLVAGELDAEGGLEALSHLGFEDLDYAKIDYHRALRCGFPEVIFGAGKTPEQIAGIVTDLVSKGDNALVTRLEAGPAAQLAEQFPQADYHALARTLSLVQSPPEPRDARIAIISAGSSDAAVANEACETLRFLGFSPQLIQDVGVAGIHRLLSRQGELRHYEAIIVAASMEGALPSVIGGLVPAPVIAVPTSVGYGASFGGVSALLGMLNSCASGVTVTNIDNGFGAACAAARIAFAIEARVSSRD